jgi:hypothetical protein
MEGCAELPVKRHVVRKSQRADIGGPTDYDFSQIESLISDYPDVLIF